MLNLPGAAFKWVFDANSWYLNDYTSFERPPMSLFDKEFANTRDRLIQIHKNKQHNIVSNLINTERTSPSGKQRNSCKEQSERQPTSASDMNENKINRRKNPRHPKLNSENKPENVQEKRDTLVSKSTISPRSLKKKTQKQTNTIRIQIPIVRTDAKENTNIPALENHISTSEHEPVSKKSKIKISSFTGTTAQKHRSQSVNCATLQTRFRTRLKAKSLTHLSDIESLRSFKIDDCVKRIKKWRLKPIPLQNLPARNHLKLDEPCMKQSKKRRRVDFTDSSDKESGPTNPKQVRTDSVKNRPHDKEREIKSPSSQAQKAVRPTTRKEMLVLLFGEDSETEEESRPCSNAGTTSSKKPSELIRSSVKKALVKGDNKLRSDAKKIDKPAEARPKVPVQKRAANRIIVLSDLFPDPTEAFEKQVESRAQSRHSSKSQKSKSTRLKLPQQQQQQQRCKKEIEPSLMSNATIKSPGASCTSKPKTASKNDIKVTLPKILPQPVPAPLMAMQEEHFTKFEICPALSSSVPAANQKAKIVHEEGLCTEACIINSVDVHVLPKNEVLVKEEELTGSAINSELPQNSNGGASIDLHVKSESLDMYKSCVNAPLENCFASFQTARPLPPKTWPAKERIKSRIEQQRCTERCNVSSIATVKDDSRVVKSNKESITLYSCVESSNDDVQIVSVTVPASLVAAKRNESAPNSTNVLSFSVDLKSLGSAKITCQAPNSEQKHVGSEPSSNMLEFPPMINTSISNAATVSDPQSGSMEASPAQMLHLSFRDRSAIEEILFNHLYFLVHIYNAQGAYLSCLQNLSYCGHYFQKELMIFEKEKTSRIQSQSIKMCSELLELNLTCSASLPETAEEIVNSIIKQLNKVDTPQRLSKSMVCSCLWTLMSPQLDLYIKVPLLKLILKHSYVLRQKYTPIYSEPFPLNMRRFLRDQIQKYNELVETTARMVTQTASSTLLAHYVLSRFPTGNSPQRPPPAIDTRRIKVHRYQAPHNGNRAIFGSPCLPTHRVTLPTSQSSNCSTSAIPRVDNFVLPTNDNFRIRLPYSRPFNSVITGPSPIMTKALNSVATQQQSLNTNGKPDQPVKRAVVQGIAALYKIGRPEDMLACQNTEEERMDTPSSPSAGSHTSKLVSRQQEKPTSSSSLTGAVGPAPEKEQRQPSEDTSKPPGRSEEPSSAGTAGVETVDSTWSDDTNEHELKEVLDASVMTELDEKCQQMALKEGDEEVTYTVVYETNLCICDEPSKYSCHCAQAWYCGKACQLKDWSSHRYVCHLVAKTEMTESPPLPLNEEAKKLERTKSVIN